MLRPKTENSVTDSQNVNQVGHNSGTMNIGLTFEQHEQNVRERIAELRADLERAHGAERAQLQAQVDAAVASLSNLQSDYEKTLVELADLKVTLARYDNVLDRTKHAAADAALDRGDRTLAKALLKELSATARARREDASKEEAELEFKLGEIAETEIRWHDGAAHFATAARLNPTFDTLSKAREFAWRAGEYAAAFHLGEDLLTWAKAQGTQEQLSEALNGHALTLEDQGHYGQAERLFRQALEIDATTSGTAHSHYATHINNLGSVVWAQGRYIEAEGLYRQSLEIDAATIGMTHPNYAIGLNNLAGALRAQGRYGEAEGLFRQALEIGAATIGTAHPDYATRLNNLAGVVEAQGRFAEAEGLFRQALEIDSATIGVTHPGYAIHLNGFASAVRSQGRYSEAEGLYRQALKIKASTIGTAHPAYATGMSDLAGVVRAQGRVGEAEGLYRQALSIDKATIGTAHPEYATRLNNLAGVMYVQSGYVEAHGLYLQALEIFRDTLGNDHPHTLSVAQNLLTLLLDHFPDDPEIPSLQALLAPTV